MFHVEDAKRTQQILSLVKLAFFIERCCEPVHITFCSAKILIFHRCKVFVSGLVTV